VDLGAVTLRQIGLLVEYPGERGGTGATGGEIRWESGDDWLDEMSAPTVAFPLREKAGISGELRTDSDAGAGTARSRQQEQSRGRWFRHGDASEGGTASRWLAELLLPEIEVF